MYKIEHLDQNDETKILLSKAKELEKQLLESKKLVNRQFKSIGKHIAIPPMRYQ